MIPRIIYQGQHVTASASFFDDAGKVMEPLDPSVYPVFVVLDSNKRTVVSGVGSLSQATGTYETDIDFPELAPLSDLKEPYCIKWLLKDKRGIDHVYSEGFDVVSPSYNVTDTKEHQKVTLPFIDLQLSAPFMGELESPRFTLYNGDAESFSQVPKNTGVFTQYYVYSVEVPAGTLVAGTDYMGVWQFKLGGLTNAYTQPIYCATLDEMKAASDLRMYLDKVMKDIDIFQGYRDSDLIFHYRQAPELINTIGLYTTWTLGYWNTTLKEAKWMLMEAAKYSALRAQYLAEGDSAFDFNSQSATLSVDHTQYIEAELGRIWDYLQNTVPQFKKAVIKSMSRMGHLGVSWPNVGTFWGRLDRQFEGVPLPRPIMGV